MSKGNKMFILKGLVLSGLAVVPLVSWGIFSKPTIVQSKKAVTIFAQATSVKQEIPQSIMPCLPKEKSVKSLEFEAVTFFEGKRYYLITVKEEVNSIFEGEKDQLQRLTTVQEDNLGCLVLIPRELSMRNSMTLYIPVPVARQLTLDFVKKRVQKAGGKEKFLQSYDEIPRDAADSPWIFFPEDVWAYEQLGLKLPKPSVVVNSWDEVEPQAPPGGY
jgi:hypothetical protein